MAHRRKILDVHAKTPLKHVFRLTLLAFAATIAVGCAQQQANIQVEFRIPVEVIEVVSDDVESVITATGTLRTVRIATLQNEVPGYLYVNRDSDGQRIQEGSAVKAGQTIAEITGEDARLYARIESNRLTMEAAEAELERRRDMFAKQMTAEVDVRQQEVTYENAKFEFERSVRNAQKSQHISPIDGIVLTLARGENNMPVVDGQLIAAGFKVAEIAPLDILIADVDLIGPELSRVQIDQNTRVRHNAYRDRTFVGKVIRLSPTLNPTTHTFRVEVEVDNSEGMLRPGMFVEVLIVEELREQVTVVPRSSVARRSGDNVVFLLDGQRASQQTVRLGLGEDDKVEILEGLVPGDQIVVQGLETLTDGARVRVVGS